MQSYLEFCIKHEFLAYSESGNIAGCKHIQNSIKQDTIISRMGRYNRMQEYSESEDIACCKQIQNAMACCNHIQNARIKQDASLFRMQ